MPPKTTTKKAAPAAATGVKKPAASAAAAKKPITATAVTKKPAAGAAKPATGAAKPAKTSLKKPGPKTASGVAKKSAAATGKHSPIAASEDLDVKTPDAQVPPEPVKPPTPPPPVQAQVMVKYNHYKEKFPTSDGVVQFSSIDEQYCLSLVFPGNFIKTLKDSDGNTIEKTVEGDAWSGLCPDGIYTLYCEEDPDLASEPKASTKIQWASGTGPAAASGVGKATRGSQEATAALKALSVEDIAGKSEEYKRLVEERDLCDALGIS